MESPRGPWNVCAVHSKKKYVPFVSTTGTNFFVTGGRVHTGSREALWTLG